MLRPTSCRVAELDRHVFHACAPEIFLSEGFQPWIDLHRAHTMSSSGEKRCEIAAAGPHFECPVGFPRRQFLEDARFELGLHHALVLVRTLV